MAVGQSTKEAAIAANCLWGLVVQAAVGEEE